MKRPAIIAHRGGAGLWPENTVHAFTNCIDTLLVDVVEFDVRLTGDDEVIVLHDPTVERTTDGTGVASKIKLKQIKKLDAGYRFRKKGKTPLRGKGITVPTLQEALDALPDTHIILEVKKDQFDPIRCVDRAVEVLMENKRSKSRSVTFVGSFSQRISARLRAGLNTEKNKYYQSYLSEYATGRERFLGWFPAFQASPGIELISLPTYHKQFRLDDRGFIDRCHKRGFKLWYWTINDALAMEQLIKRGADGIITDRPDKAVKLIAEL